MGPDKERQTEPGQAGSPHRVDRDHKVEPGQDRREAGDKDRDPRHRHLTVRVDRTVGWIEGPASVDTAIDQHVHHEYTTEHKDIPAEQVQSGEGDVLCSEHNWKQEVSKHGRDRRDQEKEDHDHAVHREDPVIGIRRKQIPFRCHQLKTDQRGVDPSDQEEDRDREEIEQADSLVIEGQQPRFDRMPVSEIGRAVFNFFQYFCRHK